MERSSRTPAVGVLRWAGGVLLRWPRALAWVPVGAWGGVIWTLSSRPSDDEPSSFLMSVTSNLAHAPLFGVLALWLALVPPREEGWPRLSRGAVLAILGAVVLYGLADELHQTTVAGREASVLDILTDLVGAACTLWVVGYVGRRGASERGLWTRLAAGVLACVAAALLASVV